MCSFKFIYIKHLFILRIIKWNLNFSDSKLIPDSSTDIGRECNKWRKIINEVPVEILTYGIVLNPEMSHSGLGFPRSMMKSKDRKFLKHLIDFHMADQPFLNKFVFLSRKAHRVGPKLRFLWHLDDRWLSPSPGQNVSLLLEISLVKLVPTYTWVEWGNGG